MFKKKLNKKLKLFAIGSTGYGLIEVLYRGKTHWTMLLTGGTCFVALNSLFRYCEKMRMIKKCVLGSALITFCELVCGWIVNIKLKLNVWDYTNCRFNFKGQICPFYSFLWAILCVPVSLICSFISKRGESA